MAATIKCDACGEVRPRRSFEGDEDTIEEGQLFCSALCAKNFRRAAFGMPHKDTGLKRCAQCNTVKRLSAFKKLDTECRKCKSGYKRETTSS